MRLKAAGYARDATVPLCAARIAGTTASKGSKGEAPLPKRSAEPWPCDAHGRPAERRDTPSATGLLCMTREWCATSCLTCCGGNVQPRGAER